MWKSGFVFLLFVCAAVECRKVPKPTLDKNANTAFINMEMGGPQQPKAPASVQPAAPKPVVQPAQPAPAAQPPKAVTQPPKPVQPPQPAKPVQGPAKPVPVNPAPAAHPVTTPGPGSVKQLVNFYDNQGKHSVIRPYSYAQAVRQGKQ